MIIYHGSREIVDKPEFGKGKKENDYGPGFYCTESPELAKEWACPVLADGFANKYELNMEGLTVLDLGSSKYHILNWLALLLKNRLFDISQNKQLALAGKKYIIDNFMPETGGFDIIRGYRADDRYFGFAKDFIQGTIPVSTLAKAMKLGELGEQIALVSEKSFQNITFVEFENADSSKYYYKRKEREKRANDAFAVMHDKASLKNDIFILDIIRQEIKNDDRRLR